MFERDLTEAKKMEIPRLAFSLALYCLLLAALPARIGVAAVPAPPELRTKSHLIVDYRSGTVLAEYRADDRVEPASLTKLMTVQVALGELAKGNISLDEKVTVSDKAWRTGGSRTFIQVNTEVSVHDLLMGIIVQSGNDASVALAEHIAGSEEVFAELMNQHAAAIGMTGSHFMNATGWPQENHYTTARDMALLAAVTIRDYPDQYAWYAAKEFTYNGIKQSNRNRLLWRDKSADGMKTGHTETAGYCLVASARREDQRILGAFMGAPSDAVRFEDAIKMLNYGFRFYESARLATAGESQSQAPVFGGAEESVQVGVAEDFYLAIPRGEREEFTTKAELIDPIVAPIRAGAKLGKLRILHDQELVAERPLVALAAVGEGSLWRRLVDQVWVWMQ